MIYISRKHLSRRTLLRGAGACIALPFLDAMQPALSAIREPPRRLSIVEFPMGVVDATWDPVGDGVDYQISDSLAPLAHHRQKMTIIRGFTTSPDRTKTDFHDRAVTSFLTGCEKAFDRVHVGVSVDQVAAKVLGQQTRFGSLELATQGTAVYGALCYRDADTELPMQINPRLLFERLFGDTDKIDPEAQRKRMAEDARLLDGVKERLSDLNRKLGAADQRRLEQYTESLRDVERRLTSAPDNSNVPHVTRPPGIPNAWPDHVRLMLDLQVLALQTDLTRVLTFSTTGEGASIVFSHLGIRETFHEISHHNNQQEKLAALSKINKEHSSLLAYYLNKLDAVRETQGTMLDNTLVLYGSPMSNPSVHSQRNVPIIVAGGGSMGVKGGRFVRVSGAAGGPPLTNLHLALLGKLGIPTEALGDSTGVYDRLGG